MKESLPRAKEALSFWRQPFLPEAVVFLIAFLIYGNTFLNGYNLDDNLVTQSNELTTQGISAIPQIFKSPYYKDEMGYSYGYRPVTSSVFAIQHQFLGNSPLAGHFLNVLLYSLLCLVLYKTLLRAFIPGAHLLALTATLLFTTHPIHTEVVASIKNRDEILALLFVLTATITNHRFGQTCNWKYSAATFLLFALAILSKPSAISFFVMFPLQLIFFSSVGYYTVMLLSALFTLSVPYSGSVYDIRSLLFYLSGTCIMVTLLYTYIRQVPVKQITQKKCLWLQKKILRVHDWFFVIRQNTSVRFSAIKSRIKAAFRLLSMYITLPALGAKSKMAINTVVYMLLSVLSIGFMVLGYFTAGIALLLATVLYYLVYTGINFSIAFIPVYLLISFHTFYYYRQISSIVDVLYMMAPLVMLLTSSRTLRIIWALIYAAFCIAAWALYDIYNFVFILPLIYWGYKRTTGKLVLAVWLAILLLMLAEIITSTYIVKGNWLPIELARVLSFLLVLAAMYKRESIRLVTGVLFLFTVLASSYHLYNDGYSVPQITLPDKNKLAFEINEVKQKGFNKVNDIAAKTKQNVQAINLTLSQRAKQLPTTMSSQVNRVVNTKIEAALPFTTDRPYSYIEAPVTPLDPLDKRLGTALVIMLRYFKLLLVPFPQAFYYGYKEIEPVSMYSIWPVFSMLFYGGIFLAAVFLLNRMKAFSFLLIYFLLTMSAVSTFMFVVPGMMADRYMLAPSIAFCVFVSIVILKATGRGADWSYVSIKSLPQKLKYSLALLLIIYSAVTISRNTQWKDQLTLMRHDINHVPQSAQAHNLLAYALMKQSTQETNPSTITSLQTEATIHFKKALDIYPAFFNVAYDLGRVYLELNQPQNALEAFQLAERIDPHHQFPSLCFTLAELYLSQGQDDSAIAQYRHTIRLTPNDYAGYDKLSYLYYLRKQYTQAIEVNRQALQKMPDNYILYGNIGHTYKAMNQKDSALLYYQKALRLNPNDKNIAASMQSLSVLP